MKKLFVSFLALCSSTVFAATPTCSPLTEFDRTKCDRLQEGSDPNGQWWGYWWKRPDGVWTTYYRARLNSYAVPGAIELLNAVKSAPSFASGVQIAQAAFEKLPLPGSQEEYNFNVLLYSACKTLEVNLPAGANLVTGCSMAVPVPPAPVWVVDAATSADGTRPAYTFIGGVRSTVSTGRAVSGSACKPEISQSPSGVTGKVFAAFGPKFDPGWQALCKRP